MQQLIALLQSIPEYRDLSAALAAGDSAAVTGIGQINRSHMLSGLYQDLKRPLVVVCQDDLAARRLQQELKDFLGLTAPILPSRELTFYDTAAASRSWEQKRLQQLYHLAIGDTPLQIFTWESLSLRTMPRQVLLDAAFHLEVGKEYPRLQQLYHLAIGDTPLQIFTWESLSLRTMPRQVLLDAAFHLEVGKEYPLETLLYHLAIGDTPLQIFTWESLSLRTMPRQVLLDAAFHLEVGKEYPLETLLRQLTAAGYSRCGMVEGRGQFAVRGGIVDIFSPAAEQPVRAEFFGDELDTMGYFDPQTQRRCENIDKATILPVSETQPSLHPQCRAAGAGGVLWRRAGHHGVF